MKIDRILEIVVYLLNHEVATAKQLSQRFHVSVRTIQRDIDTISLASIPITSNVGSKGGYSIDKAYKLQNHFVKKEDFQIIVMALKSLNTGYENSHLDGILDKYIMMADEMKPNIYLDYSVSKENDRVQNHMKRLEQAVTDSIQITFDYRNIHGQYSNRTVYPHIIKFKWYAWYLFAYDINKAEWRTFKVARIENIKLTDVSFQKFQNVEKIMACQEREYLNTCEKIEIWCNKNDIILLEEYFPQEVKEQLEDGHYIMHLHVPPDEILWQALLLSMGNKIKVLSPLNYQQKLIQTAQNFLSNYDS